MQVRRQPLHEACWTRTCYRERSLQQRKRIPGKYQVETNVLLFRTRKAETEDLPHVIDPAIRGKV